MTSEEFRLFARTYKINPAVEFTGSLHDGCMALIEQVTKIDPSVQFVPSTNRLVLEQRFIWTFQFDTLDQAIIKIEAEYPVQFALTDTEDDGVKIGLEWYPRVLTFKEAIEYRRTHPEP